MDDQRSHTDHLIRPRADATPHPLRALFTCAGTLFLFLLIAYAHPLVTAAATITVTNTTDVTTPTDNGVSLREAVLSINQRSDFNSDVTAHRTGTYGAGDAVQFAAGAAGTIKLTGGTLTLAASVTIRGPSAALIVDGGCTVNISGQCASGGAAVFIVNGSVSAVISGLTIQHGNGTAGGIANSGTLTVTSSTLINNTALSGGGGIANFGTLTVTNSTFTQNVASLGGGIFTSGGTMMLTNCSLSGNISTTADGGVENAVGTATLINTLVAGNTAPLRPDAAGAFAAGSQNNLIGDGTGVTGITNGTNGNLVGTSANPINPLLGPFGNYGGQTQTFPLLPGSPAINAGDDTTCNATTGTAPVGHLDQRGVFRPQGLHCDTGAFESQDFVMTASGTNQAARPNVPFGGALSVIVTSGHNEPVQGGRVIFTVFSASGAAATLNGNPAPIDASGAASVTATANGIAGTYSVGASVATNETGAFFNLTNGQITCTVDSTLDLEETGKRTLRDAVNSANGGGCSGNLITFDATAFPSGTPTTIALNGTVGQFTLIPVASLPTFLTIDGTGHAVAISGGGATRLFTVDGRVSLTLVGLTLRDGNAGNDNGGAVLNFGTLIVTDCSFTGNTSAGATASGGGGAIYSNSATAAITGSTFSNNSAGSGGTNSFQGGGAIYNLSGTLTIASSTFTSNRTDGTNPSGGAIQTRLGTVIVTGSTFTGNSTSDSGGALDDNGGTLVMTNSTVAANLGVDGGGIDVRNVGAITLKNVTVTANAASVDGGGILVGSGTITLTNSVIAVNTGPAAHGPDVSGPVTSGGHNLVGKADGSTGFTATGDQTGTIAAPLDPHLGPLANNGGPTQTVVLLPDSTAIDTADAAVCAASPVSGKDQRGIARRGDRCSIGAFEADPAIPNALPPPQPPGINPGNPSPLPTARPAGANSGIPAPLPPPRP